MDKKPLQQAQDAERARVIRAAIETLATRCDLTQAAKARGIAALEQAYARVVRKA